MSNIKDITLAPSGHQKIEWVQRNCPLLRSLMEEYSVTQPLKGVRIALSVHLEAKTAFLCRTLKAAGAEMFVTGSNPLSTQDDVAAALVEDGMEVFAWYDCTEEEYFANIREVLENDCQIIVDDGGDLVHMLHTEMQDKLRFVIGGCEETTTGIIRLRSMDQRGELAFPMVMVNEAQCKHFFDNRYGTGQSVFDGINRTTNLIVAGKAVVVAGYGWCGKGTAMRAKGLGARVIEKHYTLNKTLTGNDHYHAMDPEDARDIIAAAQKVEELMGNPALTCLETESAARANARRSIVSACAIPAGTVITAEMLTAKRPGTGISPVETPNLVGKVAATNIGEDEIMKWEWVE
ncbi:MAG: adenosylhomocysteinase [Parasporobacterium sp.]|nr:adenosylhomocysteinase [Parasporobacterium sp.]